MLQFFIELYENILYTYNHLEPEKEILPSYNKYNSIGNNNLRHHIITIHDDNLNPITYDYMLNNTRYSLQDLIADISKESSNLPSPPKSHDIKLNMTSSTIFHDIRLNESVITDYKVFEDYCMVPSQHRQISDEWEIV